MGTPYQRRKDIQSLPRFTGAEVIENLNNNQIPPRYLTQITDYTKLDEKVRIRIRKAVQVHRTRLTHKIQREKRTEAKKRKKQREDNYWKKINAIPTVSVSKLQQICSPDKFAAAYNRIICGSLHFVALK